MLNAAVPVGAQIKLKISCGCTDGKCRRSLYVSFFNKSITWLLPTPPGPEIKTL